MLAWSLYASDYSRYLPSDSSPQKVFWYTLLGMSLASGWLEILGLLVAGQATGGESSDTIFQVLGGSGNIIAILAMVAIAVGTVAVNAMNDYTGSLSLQAAGLRIKRIYSAVDRRRARLPVHALPQRPGRLRDQLHELPAVHQLLDCAVRRRRPRGLVAAEAACRRQPPERLRRAADGGRRDRALVIGFLVGIPFQNSSLGYELGGPFNYITVNYLHGADIAYYVGGVVAAVIYIIGARKAVRAEG